MPTEINNTTNTIQDSENPIKISIIIPYHTETPNQIRPLMCSIDQQIGIDFNKIEIILCNDMLDQEAPIDTYDFAEYTNINSRIRKIKSDYPANPGMSRQKGIDACNGDYVFFCDADDSLYTLGVLRELLDNINKTHSDVYRFHFIEEIGSEVNDITQYQQKNFNWVWVFAKAYRVKFLIQNNIRFAPENRWHEDVYFNLLCKFCDPAIIDIDTNGYLWKYSRTSVTRVNNHEYTFNSAGEHIDAVGRAFTIIKHTYGKNCSVEVLKIAVHYYYMLNNPKYAQNSRHAEIEKAYYNFLCQHAGNLFDEFDDLIEKSIAKIIVAFNETSFLPQYTFKQYLTHLRQTYMEFVD